MHTVNDLAMERLLDRNRVSQQFFESESERLAHAWKPTLEVEFETYTIQN